VKIYSGKVLKTLATIVNMKSGHNIFKQIFQLTFVIVLFLRLMSSFFFIKVVEPVHLSKAWKTVLFTASNFGKEKKCHSVVSLVTG